MYRLDWIILLCTSRLPHHITLLLTVCSQPICNGFVAFFQIYPILHSSNPNRTPKYMRDSQFHTLTQATHSLFFLFHSMFMKKYENKDCLEQFLWYLENGEIESFIFQCIYVWSFSLEIFQNHFNEEYSSIKGNSSEPNSQYLGVIRGPLLRLNTGRSGKENGSIKASHRINIESCSQYAISHTTI